MSSGLAIEVNISGEAKLMEKLVKLGEGALDFKSAMDKAGGELVAYFGGQVFESQGGVFGTPWEALSPSTQAFKEKHYREYAAVPLMATGKMRKSFVYTASSRRLTVKNTAPYFKYHQSTAPRQKIPRRPMIAINQDVKDIVRDAVKVALEEQLAGL